MRCFPDGVRVGSSVLPDGLSFQVTAYLFLFFLSHVQASGYCSYTPWENDIPDTVLLSSTSSTLIKQENSAALPHGCQVVRARMSAFSFPTGRPSPGPREDIKRYITSPYSSMRTALWRWRRTTVHSSGILAELPQHDFPVGEFHDRKKWLADVGKRRFTLRFQGAESSEQRGRNSATDHRRARCCRGLRFQSDADGLVPR